MSAAIDLRGLSLVRVDGVRGVPPVPTNEQRVQTLRARLPVQFGNATFLRSPAERYAAEQSAPSDDDTRQAALFHFGAEV